MRRFFPPAEACLVALVIVGSCVYKQATAPPVFEGEVLERHQRINGRGEVVIELTVGWRTSPDLYEAHTQEYPLTSREARLSVGDCVTVEPYGRDVLLSPCS